MGREHKWEGHLDRHCLLRNKGDLQKKKYNSIFFFWGGGVKEKIIKHKKCFSQYSKKNQYNYGMFSESVNYKYTRDVRKELLISIWRLQISSKPKSAHFMPSKNSLWLEMQCFNRCIHFLKASRYADLGTVIRY